MRLQTSRFGPVLAVVCLTAAMLLGSTSGGRAERERPPPAHTGGFGEPLCTECHFQADVNAGPGTLSVAGLPPEYEPGTIYTLTIILAQQDLSAGGFQLSARLDDGSQAGSLAAGPADGKRVDVTTSTGVQYVHHILAGTPAFAPDTARWEVLWTAPAAGAVVFHVAANAADDDESPLGDMIYATSLTSVVAK